MSLADLAGRSGERTGWIVPGFSSSAVRGWREGVRRGSTPELAAAPVRRAASRRATGTEQPVDVIAGLDPDRLHDVTMSRHGPGGLDRVRAVEDVELGSTASRERRK